MPEGPAVVVWLCDACVEQHRPPSASAARDAVWAFLERLGEHVWPMCVTCADAIGAPHETSEIVLDPGAVTGP